MKVCPRCGKVIGFNSYFGAYICEDCEWEDDTYYKERVDYFVKKSNENQEPKNALKFLLSRV